MGFLIAATLGATAWSASALLRPASFAPRLVSAYVLAWSEVVALAVLLSPFRLLTPVSVLAAQTLVLIAVLAVRRARSPTAVRPLSAQGLGFLVDAQLLPLALAVGASSVYAAVVGVALPPSNWDALTYHLARAAAWRQQEAVAWIAHAPTARMNEFPPNAEIGVLWTFLAGGSERFAAVPQLLAMVAIVLAVFVIAVRAGWTRAQAAFGALLTGTLPQVALQSTTAQNDLVVASLVAATAALLLGRQRRDHALAGVAFGLALGTKLTAVFAAPALVVLGAVALRRRVAFPLATAASSFAALSSWAFLRNLERTGSPLGEGEGQAEYRAEPTPMGVASSVVRVLYRFVDASGLESPLSWHGSALVGSIVAALLLCRLRHPRTPASLAAVAALAALPLLAVPGFMATAAAARVAVTHAGLPLNPPQTTSSRFDTEVNWAAHEDLSYFGPIGILLLVVLGAEIARRGNPVKRALAISLPLFVLGLALAYRYNVWVGRFMLVPVVLAAPLLAGIARRRGLALVLGCAAATWLVAVHAHNVLKPATGGSSFWGRSRAELVGFSGAGGIAEAVGELERRVPEEGCVGAVLGPNDGGFVLYGRRLRRRVTYLPRDDALQGAARAGLTTVVFGHRVAAPLDPARWRIEPLGFRWRLATLRSAETGACAPNEGAPTAALGRYRGRDAVTAQLPRSIPRRAGRASALAGGIRAATG